MSGSKTERRDTLKLAKYDSVSNLALYFNLDINMLQDMVNDGNFRMSPTTKSQVLTEDVFLFASTGEITGVSNKVLQEEEREKARERVEAQNRLNEINLRIEEIKATTDFYGMPVNRHHFAVQKEMIRH